MTHLVGLDETGRIIEELRAASEPLANGSPYTFDLDLGFRACDRTAPGPDVERWFGMARLLLPDDLWDEISPLLPPPRPSPKGGRRPIENRSALTGILFVLRSGLPWEMLPAERGCGSGMSCWRLRDWQAAGM